MKEKIGYFLRALGYVQAITSYAEFMVFYLPENGTAEVVLVIDYQKEIYLTKEAYNGIRKKFLCAFQEKGFNTVHMLTIVLHKEILGIEDIFKDEVFGWYLNTETNRLIVPEFHVEDFYGLRKKADEFLAHLDEYDEAKIQKEDKKEETGKKKKPFINLGIIFLNIMVFLVCAFTGGLLYNKGAFSYYVISETKEYYRCITSVFLHNDIYHLFGNMIMLYFIGNMVEENIGHIKYALLYFLAAAGGTFLSAVNEIYKGSAIITYGASGAVYGIIGAILVLVISGGGYWKNISLTRMALMIIYSLYSGFAEPNVNNAAHIGGLVTGFIIMGILCITDRIRRKTYKEVLHEN